MREKVILPETIKGRNYSYVVNLKELYDMLTDWGYQNVAYIEKKYLDEEYGTNVKKGKGIVAILYQDDFDDYVRSLKYRNRNIQVYSNLSVPDEIISKYEKYNYIVEDDRIVIRDIDSFLDYACWILKRADEIMNERHIIDSDLYTGRCGNCGTHLPIGAKYCIKCGTRRGDGLFEPMSNNCDILYGSPGLFKMQCSECKHTWIMSSFDRECHCPECGNMAYAIKEDEDLPWLWFLDMSDEELEERKRRLMEE